MLRSRQPPAHRTDRRRRPRRDAADADRRRPEPVRRVPGACRGAGWSGRRDPPRRPRPPPVLRGARAAVRGARDRRAGHRLVRPDGRPRAAWRRVRLRAARDADDVGGDLGRHHGRGRGAVGPRWRSAGAGGRLHARLLHGRSDVVPRGDARPRPRRRDGHVRHARRPVAQRRPGAGRRGEPDHRPGPGAVRRRRRRDHARGDRLVRRGTDGGRRRPPPRDLPGCAAQLLRPQGDRVRRRQRGGLGRGPALHPGANARASA